VTPQIKCELRRWTVLAAVRYFRRLIGSLRWRDLLTWAAKAGQHLRNPFVFFGVIPSPQATNGILAEFGFISFYVRLVSSFDPGQRCITALVIQPGKQDADRRVLTDGSRRRFAWSYGALLLYASYLWKSSMSSKASGY
jgi:hypothetical protein